MDMDSSAQAMSTAARIYVAGHRGLVGSALVRTLQKNGYRNLILRTHADLDLAEGAAVARFLASERPEYVLIAAARVGGILANNTYPADFIRENLAIQGNIIQYSWTAGVKRLLFLGSSCIYPRLAPQPIFPAHWSRPIDRIRWLRSRASRCAGPITGSMGLTT